MRIAICEDNAVHAEILEKMINCWAEQEKLKVEIGTYRSAEQFLFLAKEQAHYDLAFLDIQMDKINGLQLAGMIRKDDPTIILIFTTGERKYAPKGYEVSAFRYLLKPLKEKEVIDALRKVNKMIEEKNHDAVVVPCEDGVRRVLKNDIYYIEAEDHYIVLHMKEEEIRFRAKFKDVEKQFSEPQFCKCHRSYIVNLHYVEKISREGVEMEQGIHLPVSRGRWDVLNQCYLNYFTKW